MTDAAGLGDKPPQVTHHHERGVLLALPFLGPGAAGGVEVLAVVGVRGHLDALADARGQGGW